MLNRFYFRKAFLPALCGLLLLGACKKSQNKNGIVPRITFESLSADSIVVGSSDGLLLQFAFVDGDGDLVVKRNTGKRDIYLNDSRDSLYNLGFYFPSGTITYANTKTGVSGICTIEIPAAALEMRPDRLLRDTLVYEYYIVDRAGHESNRLKTPPIYLIRP